MVQGESQDTLKKKVAKVKEVVPSWSKHHIILLLTHFNQNVEETIQAIVENQAEGILQQWQSTSATNKPSGKKKKKNKSNKEAPLGDASSGNTDSGTTALVLEQNALEQRPEKTRQRKTSLPLTAAEEPRPKETTAVFSEPCGTDDARESDECFVSTAAYQSEPEVPFVSKQVNHTSSAFVSQDTDLFNSVTPDLVMASGGETQKGNDITQASSSVVASSSGGRPQKLDLRGSQISRERTTSERSTSSASSRKPHGGLERCYKDLQRQTASLERHKRVIVEQMTKSMKELQRIFDQLKEELAHREVELMCELNKEKNDGENWLNKRHQTALELKHRLEKVPSMKENDVINLRAEIKHFVSERRIDEDIASTKRFSCDFDSFRSQIRSFGQVIPIKAAYTIRNPSVSSVSSSLMSPDDVMSPSTPHLITSQNAPQDTDSCSISSSTGKADVSVPGAGSAAKVISQSESLTRYEQLTHEDQRPSSTSTKPSRGRGQSYSGRGQARRGQGQRDQPIRDQEPKDQGARGPGSRGPSSRGQGSRGQGPRSQGSRGPKPEIRNQGHGDAREQQNSGGNQTSHDKQDVTRRGRNARHRERQQQASKDAAEYEQKDAADTKTASANHVTRIDQTGAGSPRRNGRNERNSSPRKRGGKGQGQPNKNSELAVNHEANGQQTVRPSGHGDQGRETIGHDGQGEDAKGHGGQGRDVVGHEDQARDARASGDGEGHGGQGHGGQGHGGQGHGEESGRAEAETDQMYDKEHGTVSGGMANGGGAQNGDGGAQNGDGDAAERGASLANGRAEEEGQRSAVVVSVKGAAGGRQNGLVERPGPVKKATVSIERLHEVTRATISVDGLGSAGGPLPQRERAPRRGRSLGDGSG